MNKRQLGNTGITVSEVAFGGVEIGMPYGIGVESAADMLTEAEAIQLLQAALHAGINFFDTARQYGQSEAIMGKAFAGKRNEVVIATKCRHLGHEQAPLQDVIEQSLAESLAALQTDCVDIYMLHDSDPKIIAHPDVISKFAELKRSGRIKATGISTYTPEETSLAIESGHWDMIQVPFNIMDQRQEALFEQAADKGIGIVIRSVLMKGLLSDRGRGLHPALQKVEQHIEHLHQLAQQSSLDLPTLATRFALSFKNISAILIGIDRIDYLNKSMEAANGYLAAPLLQKAKALAYPEPDFLNLHHWNVMGWLK
jgi:Predicted oxidoreductases (related to aryl-alcohol dehydrogenases)